MENGFTIIHANTHNDIMRASWIKNVLQNNGYEYVSPFQREENEKPSYAKMLSYLLENNIKFVMILLSKNFTSDLTIDFSKLTPLQQKSFLIPVIVERGYDSSEVNFQVTNGISLLGVDPNDAEKTLLESITNPQPMPTLTRPRMFPGDQSASQISPAVPSELSGEVLDRVKTAVNKLINGMMLGDAPRSIDIVPIVGGKVEGASRIANIIKNEYSARWNISIKENSDYNQPGIILTFSVK